MAVPRVPDIEVVRNSFFPEQTRQVLIVAEALVVPS